MRFPFVKRKDYEEVVDKLEALLCEATGCRLSKHTYPLHTMYKAVNEWIQYCCDAETSELKAEIEKLDELCAHFESRVRTLSICNAKLEENYNRACAQRDARKSETEEKLHPYKLHYGNLRMEIAREVCDRLKAKGVTAFRGGLVVTGNNIDNLLEEMEKECEGN